MRTQRKNKRKLYYALYVGETPVYQTDSSGNIIYDTIGGKSIPRKTGTTKKGYGPAVKFWGNLHGTSGEAEAVPFGVNVADYDSILYMTKDSIPLKETSLIWADSEVKLLSDGSPDPKSADYRVGRVPECLDECFYLLKRVEK